MRRCRRVTPTGLAAHRQGAWRRSVSMCLALSVGAENRPFRPNSRPKAPEIVEPYIAPPANAIVLASTKTGPFSPSNGRQLAEAAERRAKSGESHVGQPGCGLRLHLASGVRSARQSFVARGGSRTEATKVAATLVGKGCRGQSNATRWHGGIRWGHPSACDSPDTARILADLNSDSERLREVRRNSIREAARRYARLHEDQVVRYPRLGPDWESASACDSGGVES